MQRLFLYNLQTLSIFARNAPYPQDRGYHKKSPPIRISQQIGGFSIHAGLERGELPIGCDCKEYRRQQSITASGAQDSISGNTLTLFANRADLPPGGAQRLFATFPEDMQQTYQWSYSETADFFRNPPCVERFPAQISGTY